MSNAHDAAGRLLSSTSNMDGVSRIVASYYDADGKRWRLDYPEGGGFFTYAYDGAGALTSIKDAGSATLINFIYDALGRLVVSGNWMSSSYGYDGAGRLNSLGHDLAGTSADQSYTFGYNPASQLTTRTSSNDAYASNAAYNVSRGYSVNGLNQYIAAGPASFTYDANGNLTSDGSTSYVYDAENRLVSASGAHSATLSYDPLGRLWQVSSPSAPTTRFVYDGDALIAEYDTIGNLRHRYVHGPDAKADDPLVWYDFTTGTAAVRSLVADHQGSIVAVADYYGNPLAVNGYDAWGIPNATNKGRFGYTGQTWLPELGLWYYKARAYSPTLGRFLQTDPVGYKDQVNLYAYVNNDPVDHTDPSGEEAASYYGSPDNLGGMKGGHLPTLGQFIDAVLTIGSFFVPGAEEYGVERVGTEVVERAMSRAELRATQESGLLRGGRNGEHFVSNHVNRSAQRAQQRLALPVKPEVRVRMEVPRGKFSPPSKVKPDYPMPGGGIERRATGNIPVRIRKVEDMTK